MIVVCVSLFREKNTRTTKNMASHMKTRIRSIEDYADTGFNCAHFLAVEEPRNMLKQWYYKSETYFFSREFFHFCIMMFECVYIFRRWLFVCLFILLLLLLLLLGVLLIAHCTQTKKKKWKEEGCKCLVLQWFRVTVGFQQAIQWQMVCGVCCFFLLPNYLAQ